MKKRTEIVLHSIEVMAILADHYKLPVEECELLRQEEDTVLRHTFDSSALREEKTLGSSSEDEPEKKKRLSPNFSVFNKHLNDADLRARRIMALIRPRFLERIETIEVDHDGIMAVLEAQFTDCPACAVYIALVTLFVNGEGVFYEEASRSAQPEGK